MLKKIFTLITAFFLFSSHTLFATPPATVPSSSSKPIPTLKATKNIDTVLTEKVQAAITKVKSLKGQSVSAASHERVVTLEGSVETKEQEKAAIQAAKMVKGVKEVKSQLTIKFGSKN